MWARWVGDRSLSTPSRVSPRLWRRSAFSGLNRVSAKRPRFRGITQSFVINRLRTLLGPQTSRQSHRQEYAESLFHSPSHFRGRALIISAPSSPRLSEDLYLNAMGHLKLAV